MSCLMLLSRDLFRIKKHLIEMKIVNEAPFNYDFIFQINCLQFLRKIHRSRCNSISIEDIKVKLSCLIFN